MPEAQSCPPWERRKPSQEAGRGRGWQGAGGDAGAGRGWRRECSCTARGGALPFTNAHDVEYKEYTWQSVQQAFKDTIKELNAKLPLTPEMAKLPADGPFARPDCLRNTIVVLGHSFGGNAAYDYVNLLKDQKIRVDDVVTADPRHPPGFPPGDTVPYQEPANVFSWENYYETQQTMVGAFPFLVPFELFGAQVTGAINVHLQNSSWDAGWRAHLELPSAPQVLDAVRRAVKDAGEYRTSQVASA